MAKVLAAVFGRRLIRLQCYEGIDTNQALYEWDYARQMLQIRALSERQLDDDDAVDKLFGPKFLLERPLLEAVRAGDRAVLLIDEVDRADDEFEAFLLELLSDFQITIPEIGTIAADTPPLVVLTSNRTRELHDALKRRCLYHWVGYPSAEREVEIVLVRDAGRVRGAGPQGRGRRQPAARARPGQAAGRGRDDRLGAHARGARRGPTSTPAPSTTPSAPSSRSATTSSWCASTSRRSSPVPDDAPFVELLVDFGHELRDGRASPSGSGDVLTYCAAMATARPDRPRSTSTGPAARRWSPAATRSPSYDRVFRRFFLGERDATSDAEPLQPTLRAAAPAQSVLEVPATEPGESARTSEEARLGLMASDAEVRRDKSFAACTPEELAALRRIMAPDPADAAPPPHPAHRARARRPHGPTCAARCARRCGRTASRPSCSGAAAGCGMRPLILILDVSGLDGRLLPQPAAVRLLDQPGGRRGSRCSASAPG